VTAVACTAAAALAAGAAIAYGYLAKRSLRRDSPPAPENLRLHWQSILDAQEEKQRRKAAKAGAAAGAAVPVVSGSGEVDLADLEFRSPTAGDVDAVTAQTMESFNSFNASVGLAPEFHPESFARMVMEGCIAGDEGLIAVRRGDGACMGAVFNDEADIEEGAVGCGPWSARWGATQAGVGRALVTQIVSRSVRHGASSIRLIQIAANNTSMALYTSLGFDTREPLMAWKGALRADFVAAELARGAAMGFSTRPIEPRDIAAIDAIHTECNGISRKRSLLAEASSERTRRDTFLVVLDGKKRIVGYTTGLSPINHSVAKSDAALYYVLAAAHAAHAAALAADPSNPYLQRPPYQHTCVRLYPALTRWMLDGGMRCSRQVNLMVLGAWQPIQHDRFIYCPSINY